jgi:hypothetical protein
MPIDAAASTAASERRSQRLLLRIAIQVRRQKPDGKTVTEATETLAVNAHGALIRLTPPVTKGEEIVLKNERTHEEQLCRAVYLGPLEGQHVQVGIEFLQPAPQLWGIIFTPDDWVPSPDVSQQTKKD